MALRKTLWRAGARYRKNVAALPGKPDIVFTGPRIAVFCDGDFWHGRDWQQRRGKLSLGANAAYWTAKIERNMARDREQRSSLEAAGWTVLRYWESDIRRDVAAAADEILSHLGAFAGKGLTTRSAKA